MDQGAASYRHFIDGDRDAFGEVIDLYRESLIFFIHRYVNDIDTAEDLAEDVFVELIVHPERRKKFPQDLCVCDCPKQSDRLDTQAQQAATGADRDGGGTCRSGFTGTEDSQQ